MTECNHISVAVIRKSEIDLRRGLIRSPHAINEANTLGQTALHLAIEWPAGIDLLLQAGADVNSRDHYKLSPLDYAVQRSLTEPTSSLVNATCSLLDYNLTTHHSTLAIAVVKEIDEPRKQTSNAAAKEIVDLLVNSVIYRRKKLCDLAICTLPASKITHFFPYWDHDSYLLDESASQLFSLLLSYDITVPSVLNPGSYRATVYHHIKNSTRVAEMLWKGGFRDIDGKDSLGLTPLMTMACSDFYFEDPTNSLLECVAWFLDKGVDFQAKQDLDLYYEDKERRGDMGSGQLFSATSMHFVASSLGCKLRSFPFKEQKTWGTSMFEISKTVFERVIMDQNSDDCICACSFVGCNGFTLLTRSDTLDQEWKSSFSKWADLWDFLEDSCDPLKSSEFLRMMTFERLELTHTCCCCEGIWGRISYLQFFRISDQAEIDEIHDEEAADLQKLEELLEEFEAKRIQLDLPFLDFLKLYWAPRMDEVLDEGKVDEEALRAIGVKVHEPGSELWMNARG